MLIKQTALNTFAAQPIEKLFYMIVKKNLSVWFFVAAFTIFYGCTTVKKAAQSHTFLENKLRSHVQYLADDKLEGRRTGTPGEALAAEYIVKQFKEIGLSPKGTEAFLQPFWINDGKEIEPATSFTINGNDLVAGTDFFPFAFSENGAIETTPSIAVQEAEEPWFFDLKETLEENSSNPHFDLGDYIRTNVKKARDRGAAAVILYNTSSTDDNLSFNGKDRSEKAGIPVLYITKTAAQKYLSDAAASIDVKLNVQLADKKRKGINVVGYIDNNAATTVVLGAHFDHLGYGEDGNSMIRTGEKLIHNGADDNASGTAALIELARTLKVAKAKNNNYLFIAFSGEELGLYGSKYFTDNPTVDIAAVNYMINLDMVGRLNDSSKTVTIGGYGTSPVWSTVIANTPALTIKIDSSGTGPSDHTSFYRKDIPVLFYFTGLHTDYHKPSDDADKINYAGARHIVQHILSVINATDTKPKLAFTKTREVQTTTSARFSVSLGIMPDYTFSGAGVRADGISEGRAAQKAGMKAGDIIIQLGDHPVSDVETYMRALSKFKKGDRTTVIFRRGSETLEAPVEF